MMQGYHSHGRNPEVVFDMFYRRQPFGGGFAVFAGLETFLRGLLALEFTEDDLVYLDGLKLFQPDFLDYLRGFSFTGDIYAMREGSVVFPNEPLVRVHGPLIEAQLIESFLLNVINYQTLVATKAARIYLASGEGTLLEFGLRRAHGTDGALSASRAAFIGGAAATSNTLAGKLLGIPVKGTMAHSWVMAFPGELEAFYGYARVFPASTILLIDTYDTLESGIANAIEVGLSLMEKGQTFFGVRLDSGDLEYLSKQVRRRLDDAGLRHAKIVVSNDLDEEIVRELRANGAPIDIWGVGTNLVTARGDPSLTGVYKLVAKKEGGGYSPTIKVSNNTAKVTNPGIKQVYRFLDGENSPLLDLLALDTESIEPGEEFLCCHPMIDYKQTVMRDYGSIQPLLSLRLRGGKRAEPPETLAAIQQRARRNLAGLDTTYKRLKNPHVYKISLSETLKHMKDELIALHTGKRRQTKG